MVICPSCGHQVADNQRFCGNCGTDVHAAVPPAPRTPPVSEQPTTPYAYPSTPRAPMASEPQPNPYAYTQPAQNNYGYDYPAPESRSPGGRVVLIGAILLIVMCCAFSCGLLLGFELIPDILGVGGSAATTPKVTPTPTPQSLLPIFHWLIG